MTAEIGKSFWKAAENGKDPKRQWEFAEAGKSETNADECSMPINTDHNSGIDPKFFSIPINANQHWDQ